MYMLFDCKFMYLFYTSSIIEHFVMQKMSIMYNFFNAKNLVTLPNSNP